MQQVIDQVGDRALATSAQAGEPHHASPVAMALLALGTSDGVLVPVDVGFIRGGGGGGGGGGGHEGSPDALSSGGAVILSAAKNLRRAARPFASPRVTEKNHRDGTLLSLGARIIASAARRAKAARLPRRRQIRPWRCERS